MNRLIFSIFVAILFILTLSQNAHGFISGNTIPDNTGFYKHDVLIKHRVIKNNSIWESICSGTIISDKHVLTAAHCVVKKESSEIKDISQFLIEVTVGIKKLDNPSSQIVRVVETIFLPYNYYNNQEIKEVLKERGDIAVLKLNRGIGLGKNPEVVALKLPSYYRGRFQSQEDYYSTRPLTATGFGILGTKKVLTTHGPKSQKVNANYLYYSPAKLNRNGSCKYDRSTSDSKLCVELTHSNNSFNCPGDSGGALLDEETMQIIGVGSTGSGECKAKIFSVYTRVIAFKEIIDKAVNEDRAIPLRSKRISFENNASYRAKINDNPRYTEDYSKLQ